MAETPAKPFPATGMPAPDWWQALWPDPVSLLRGLGFSQGQRVVDLCCGDGLFSLALLRLGCRVEGLDCDISLLDQAARNALEAGCGQAVWHLGDARNLDKMIKTPADAVLIANTFHGIEDQTNFCRLVRRVLSPGGRLVIINWHEKPREETTVLGQPRGPHSHLRMSPEKTRLKAEPSGLVLTQVCDLPPYHYAAIFS